MNESKNVLSEDQRHHLDIVEAQITRMSENSKQMKSWSIALISALIGACLTIKNEKLLIVAIGVSIVFCFLDACYLMLERRFRCIYKAIAGHQLPSEYGDVTVQPYEMNPQKFTKGKESFFSALFSWSVLVLYLAEIAASFCLWI